MTYCNCGAILDLTKGDKQMKFSQEFPLVHHFDGDEKAIEWNLWKVGTVQQKLNFGKKQPKHPILNLETSDSIYKETDRTSIRK